MGDKGQQNKPAGQGKGKPKKSSSQRALQTNIGGAMRGLSTHQKSAAAKKGRAATLAARKASIGRYRALQRKKGGNFMPLGDNHRGCRPSISVYGANVKGKRKNDWICSVLGQIRFQEQNYATREAEVRVFVEGAEVTKHLRGTINWSIQTTGGINNCSFTLNNVHNAFILTPQNICAQNNVAGWQNGDETAKFTIYKHKYKRVRPKGKKPQIDPDTGMWLYPLHPWHSVITKHDCVRVFIRLPHVSGVAKRSKTTGKIIKYREAWAPAFTGFVDEVDWEDDPVMGDQVMNVRCYDWRGLLDRMRVRVQANPSTSTSQRDEDERSPALKEQSDIKKGLKKEEDAAAAAKFLDVTHKLCINKDLIAAYKAGFAAKVEVCKQKKDAAQCQKEVQAQIQREIQDDVGQLKGAWKDLNEAITKASKVDGVKRELERSCTDSNALVTLKKEGKQYEDVIKAGTKAVKWLRSDGVALEKLAGAAVVGYTEWMGRAKTERVGSDWQITGLADALKQAQDAMHPIGFYSFALQVPREADYFRTLNQLSSIQSIASTIETKYPDAYRTIVGQTSAARNWVRLINEYIQGKLAAGNGGFFVGVPTEAQKEIDTIAITLSKGRHIFAQRKVDRTAFGTQSRAFGTDIKTGSEELYYISKEGAYAQLAANAIAQYIKDQNTANRQAYKVAIPSLLDSFNRALKKVLDKLNAYTAKAEQSQAKSQNIRDRARKSEMRRKYEQVRAEGAQKGKVKKGQADTLADLVTTDAKFSEAQAGMFADLVSALNKGKHPLENMSYEEGVQFLVLTNTKIQMGFEDELKIYERGKLEQWNMVLAFGVLQRPMTYAEVTEMGKGSIMELDSAKAPFSPLHAFMHFLLPKKGTGAQTIIQADMTAMSAMSKSYEFKTRLELLNQISQTLDYQFFVSPAGDLIFEFPNYNALPFDFGRTFQGAYTVTKGLRNFKCTEETGELNTAWVLTGQEPERIADDITGSGIIKEKLGKIVIIADLLARRIGVKKRDLKVEMPGVGAVLMGKKPISSLLAYGLLEIQRELGRMSQLSVSYDFRPYMLPNRPMHIVHRQRMALTKAINYSMTIAGECAVTSDLHYVRGLMNDGSFRHIAGGARMPVDYSGIFTGDVQQTLQYGKNANQLSKAESTQLRNEVLKMSGARRPRGATNLSCTPFMRDRWIEASSSYSDQIDSTFYPPPKYTNQTSGSGGTAGELPPQQRGAHTYIASRYHKSADGKGDPDSAVEMHNTGISRTGGNNKPTKKTPQSDLYGKVYNPWPFAQRLSGQKYSKFSNFGFTRVVYPNGKPSSSGKKQRHASIYVKNKKGKIVRRSFSTASPTVRKHKGVLGGWHNGMDFVGIKKGTKAYTPIKLYSTGAYISSGYSYYPNSGDEGKSYREIVGPASQKDIKPGSFIATFGVRRRGKTIVSRPLNLSVEMLQQYADEGREIPEHLQKRYWKIDMRAVRLWKKTGGRIIGDPATGSVSGNVVIDNKGSTKQGLVIWGVGYASLPGAPNEKVACRLHYVHCDDFVKDSKGRPVGSYRGKKPEDRELEKDQPIAVVGTTGSDNVHLHFEMYIYPPGAKLPRGMGGGTSASAWKAVLKANADFLRTQMKMKITAGNGLNSGKMNDGWKQYFKEVNKRYGTNVTTVDEATDLMLSKSSRFHEMTDPRKAGKQARIVTNPAFFFRPEQIIHDLKNEYKKYLADRQGIRYEEEAANAGQSVCVANNVVQQQKISLALYACYGKARKLKYGSRKYRSAIKECKTVARAAQADLKQQSLVAGRKPSTAGARTTQRLDRRVNKSINKPGVDRG